MNIKIGLVTIILLIVFFGRAILNRLDRPTPPRLTDRQIYPTELFDFAVHFDLESVSEEKFEVGFCDGWNVVRTFKLYGKVIGTIPPDGAETLPIPLRERVTVTVYPQRGWFETSRIGDTRVHEKGSGFFVRLPFEIAARVLDEVRREPRQIVSVFMVRGLSP